MEIGFHMTHEELTAQMQSASFVCARKCMPRLPGPQIHPLHKAYTGTVNRMFRFSANWSRGSEEPRYLHVADNTGYSLGKCLRLSGGDDGHAQGKQGCQQTVLHANNGTA
jgi:hypothetical protein